MKAALFSAISFGLIALCCGPCRGCGGGNGPMSTLTDKVADQVKEKVAERAIEEAAEYALEQAYGPDAKVELDMSERHASIQRPSVEVKLWGNPDKLSNESKWPKPSELENEATYSYNAESHIEYEDENGNTHPLMGEVAGLNYPEGQRDAVADAFRAWAKSEGFSVKDVNEWVEDGTLNIPGLNELGVKVKAEPKETYVYVMLEGQQKRGLFSFGPTGGQVMWEEQRPNAPTTFWWKEQMEASGVPE